MNYIHQINAFWRQYGMNEGISPTCIAIYFALLHLNNVSGWKSKIPVHSRELMNLIMIGSSKTFYQNLEKLSQLGLIRYEPGKNQYQHCFVELPKLYEGREVVRQNLPEHGNSRKKAGEQQLPGQSLKSIENSEGSGTTKLVNHETSKQKNKKDFLLPDIERELLTVYQAFVEKRTGFPAKLNNRDRQSLQNIAAYLQKADQNPVTIWRKLLSGWERLNVYYQTKISLEQIDNNFISLLDQIKNNHGSHRTNSATIDKRERSHAGRKDFSF